MKKTLALLTATVLYLATFAQGYYIEYTITAAGQQQGVSGNMKMYYQDGNTRSDVAINAGQYGMNIQLSTLTLKAEPNNVYMVNDKDKSYSVTTVQESNDWKDRPVNEYEVTVLGKEKVNGYNSTHVLIKVNGRTEMEMWTTKEISGYADFSKIKSKYTGKENMYKALADKGAEGAPVRIKTSQGAQSMQMDLVKAENKTNPTSLFSVSGYTKKDAFEVMPGGDMMKNMLEQYKNMTPEQREEMIKQLQQKYKHD